MSSILSQFLQTSKYILRVEGSLIMGNHSVLSSPMLNLSQSLPNHQLTAVRHKRPSWCYSRIFRQIRGGGRPLPEGKTVPIGRVYGWRPVYPADGKYTTKPLPIIKLGGRDMKTGRMVVSTIGGGHKKKFRWVDYKREGPADGSVLEEKVYQIRYDPCRTARIALVASGDHKRWIIASENTKVGDIVRTSSVIPRNPVRPLEGDAHPLGALPQGTLVHCIEPAPQFGGLFCRAAGTAAQLLRKIDNKCLVQLPSKEQILVDEKCMAVTGRVSNVGHGDIPIGSPNRLRWLGHRPRSGLWHRKDGYCGRKIHPPKGIKDLLQARPEAPEVYKLTWTNEEE